MKTMMNFRFIEAKYTPFESAGGWAVPPAGLNNNNEVPVSVVVGNLERIGLEEGTHYRLKTHGRHSITFVSQVVFETDEAFIMAKMHYG